MNQAKKSETDIFHLIVDSIKKSRKENVDQIAAKHYLFSDLGFDSLSFLEFIVYLENEFDIEFEELITETNDIQVEELVSYIQSKQEIQ